MRATGWSKSRKMAAVSTIAQHMTSIPDQPAEPAQPPRFNPRPWTPLETPQDVELWIEEHNAAMRELIRPQELGVGIRFALREGGDVHMQTTADAIVLDVDPDAAWIAPLIVAATGAEVPRGQFWVLPDDRLVQLILGLSTLIESTTLVTGHNFGAAGRRAW